MNASAQLACDKAANENLSPASGAVLCPLGYRRLGWTFVWKGPLRLWGHCELSLKLAEWAQLHSRAVSLALRGVLWWLRCHHGTRPGVCYSEAAAVSTKTPYQVRSAGPLMASWLARRMARGGPR